MNLSAIYMVKHGLCVVECKGCNYKRENRETIDSDYGSFLTVISDTCQHFGFHVQALTRNTFTPFGAPDEVTYNIEVTCQR